jgi:hypothetical protein
MADGEILSMIPASQYARIVELDPHPVFRVYGVAHEGSSTGSLVGVGTVVKNWFKNAIEKLYSKIQEGTKLFHLHNENNSHDNRQPIGEVVGKKLTTISDRLTSVVAAYIYPEYRDLHLDVASIEADIVYSKSANGIDIDDVAALTGIALGNSAVNKPGFAGATLLGCLQAFAKNEPGKGEQMTLAELKELISREKYSPSDLFTEDALIGAPVVKEHVKKEKQGEYEHRRRVEKEFDTYKDDVKKEKDGFTKSLSDVQRENLKFKVGGVFKEAAGKRQLDDKQVKFIEKKLEKFNPQDPAKFNEEVDKFVEEGLKEYTEATEIITGKKPEQKSPGVGAADTNKTAGAQTEGEKLTEPETNPLIPKP